MIRIIPIMATILILGGCATSEITKAKLREYERTIPTCELAKDCELKWSAARRWVLQNSSRKIQHITDDYIETFNPPADSPGIAVRVVKEAVTPTAYRFTVEVWCNNIFGCNPNKLDAMIAFNRHVRRSGLPGVQQPPASQAPAGYKPLYGR